MTQSRRPHPRTRTARTARPTRCRRSSVAPLVVAGIAAACVVGALAWGIVSLVGSLGTGGAPAGFVIFTHERLLVANATMQDVAPFLVEQA